MVKVASLLVNAGSGLVFSFGVRAWTERELRSIKGIHRLKLVSSENNSGLHKGLRTFVFIAISITIIITSDIMV